MDPAELEDDVRGKLQRRALGNVRMLFEKLDYKDTLDRRTERVFMMVTGVAVLLAIAAMAISAVVRSPDPGAQERARCVQEARIAAVWQLKKELREQYPEMGPAEIDKRVEVHFRDMKSVAALECASSYRKGS